MAVRDLPAEEFAALGRLLVEVYSSLPGFPTPLEQPAYYDTLSNIGEFTEKPGVKALVAVLTVERMRYRAGWYTGIPICQ